MKLYMIRHGYTKGNEEKRYVGVTDEPLSELGIKGLEFLRNVLTMIKPDVIFTSPMRRCRETAEVLFPDCEYQIVDDFRECDFGIFEYKNYQQLDGNELYQRWIDSGGTEAFPEGESPEDFRRRCRNAFLMEIKKIYQSQEKSQVETVVMVVHGGTIMAILDAFSMPHKDYFEWQIGNGNGYVGELNMETCTIESLEKLAVL